MAINALDLREARAAIDTRRADEQRELSLVRREARVAVQRNFAAAQVGRTTLDWATSILSRDQKLWTDLRKLRSRARELADNESTMTRFLDLCVSNIAGKHGVRMQPKVEKLRGPGLASDLNDQISDEWRQWCERGNCTVDGLLSFDELERLLIRTAALDGEFIVVMRPADNPWGFTLQHVDVDQLDHTYFDEKRGDSSLIRMGVEIDQFRKPLAYWLFTRHPNEYTTNANARVRVPADILIHGYLPDSALQTRGKPWAASAMYKMNMLRGYMEAEVTAARVGACQMGILINKGQDDFEGEGRNGDGTVQMDMQPGGFAQFSGDVDFKQFSPEHPAGAFSPFVKEVKRDIASSLGVASTSLGGDYSEVNFSSARAELLVERDMWRVRQKWFIQSFHKRVFKAWLAQSVLTGRISLSVRDEDEVCQAIVWHPRGWPWVDPQKDMQANITGVQNGLTTRSRVLAAQGEDLEETLAELAEEEKLIEKYGLKLGTDAKGDALAPEDSAEGTDANAQAPGADGAAPTKPGAAGSKPASSKPASSKAPAK